MKNLIVYAVLLSTLLTAGCSRQPEANTTYDKVSEPGVTQPPPPDPNKPPGENPRDRKNRKERPNADPAATPEATAPLPAPENSERSVIMNADGSITEIRVFKDHPQILKAEANWTDPKEKTLKVFLKSGKVLEAKTDKVPYLHTVSSQELLQIVGAAKGDRPRVVTK